MRKIELMVFDFDGTLVHSGNDLASSVNHALSELGIPVLDKEKVIGFIGDGVVRLIERSLGDEHQNRFDETMRLFKAHYAEHLLDTTVLYPGVPDVLEHFRGTKKVIITNKIYDYTLRISEALGIAGYFEEIIGADTLSVTKPDRELILPFLERYGAKKTETVVIGDGVNDVLLARDAGTVSCALLNGLGDRGELLSLDPDYSCEDIRELKRLFV